MDDPFEDDDQRIEVWCAGEEWCPVTTTATMIGKKWHPVIVHRLLEDGPSGFNELIVTVVGHFGIDHPTPGGRTGKQLQRSLSKRTSTGFRARCSRTASRTWKRTNSSRAR